MFFATYCKSRYNADVLKRFFVELLVVSVAFVGKDKSAGEHEKAGDGKADEVIYKHYRKMTVCRHVFFASQKVAGNMEHYYCKSREYS